LIEKLTIKNYLLLKDIEIDFSPGFNVITGETGAGKTILIDALSLLLGERADYTIISKNKEKMIIEGLVKVNRAMEQGCLSAENSDYQILRRELYSKGYSRNFINDSPVSINDLRYYGDKIIDIHSQNEHQSLLKRETHLGFLDQFIVAENDRKFSELKESYSERYKKFTALCAEVESLKNKKDELENKRAFLEFQLKEIMEVNPQSGEDNKLESELGTAEHAEQIQTSLSAAYSHLYDDRGSAIERIKSAERELRKISEFSSDVPGILSEIGNILPLIDEISRQVTGSVEKLTFDPAAIERIRERLYKLQFIKKKYGGSLDEVIKKKESFESELALLENFEDKLDGLEKEKSALQKELHKVSSSLSKVRKEKAKRLESAIEDTLKQLGLENAGFRVGFSTRGMWSMGVDDVEFLVKINKGDDFMPLRKTASGGEVSRIMLAIKSVLAGADETGTLVFDEIDTGISGRIAQKAGVLLRRLSESHQVIAITHLPQIAALAEEHFLVEKVTDGEATIARIKKMSDSEKVIEVARLLSGEKVTDSAIKSAKELMRH
jgi:DNA repair protein RecN (Recombination protein N)